MSRYRQLGTLDPVVVMDGDSGFRGVESRVDAGQVPQGMVADARNVEFSRGVARTRGGLRSALWGEARGVDFPIDFAFDFSIRQGFGKCYGACVFSDPFGQERLILAGRYAATVCGPGAVPERVAYPAGVDLEVSGDVEFTQAFNVLILWRGRLHRPLAMATGLSLEGDQVFSEVPASLGSGDYVEGIPNGVSGVHFGNRVWAIYGESQVAFSDVLDYTAWDPDLSQVYVNQGDSDALVALFPGGLNGLVCFKSGSIYALEGIVPDPAQGATLTTLTTARGLIARNAVCSVGKDVWFLSQGGVYALSQVLDSRLQAGVEAVSAPLESAMRRVNWHAADRAQALCVGRWVVFAVPMDGAQGNNALVVYDLEAKAWAGVWDSALALDVVRLVRVDRHGESSVGMVMRDGSVWILTRGRSDDVYGAEAAISMEVLTRGYTAGENVGKQWLDLGMELATWYNAGSVDARTEGPDDWHRVLTWNRTRGKSLVWGARSGSPLNQDGSMLDERLEDYSVALPVYGPVDVEREQIATEKGKLRLSGRQVQLRVRSERGSLAVRNVQVAARGDENALRREG